MYTIKLDELPHMNDGDPIERIDATVVAAYEPQTRGQYERQNLYISDASIGDKRVMVTIASPDLFQPEDIKGKRIVITAKKQTSGRAAGKVTGIKWKIEEGKNDRKYPKIWVTGTASIEIGGASAAPVSVSNNRTAGSAVSGGNAEAGLTAEQLADRFAEVIQLTEKALVARGYSEDAAISMAKNAPEWVPLWWFGQKDIPGAAPPAPSNWKDLIHPAKKKPLGECDNDSLVKLVVWAFGKEDVKEEHKTLHKMLKTDIFEELGGDPIGLLHAFAKIEGKEDQADGAFTDFDEEAALALLKKGKDEIIETLDNALPQGEDEPEEDEDFDDLDD